MSGWYHNQYKTIKLWMEKPEELKPFSLLPKRAKMHRPTSQYASRDLRTLRYNPYRGHNLFRLMRIYRDSRWPSGKLTGRIVRSLVTYEVANMDSYIVVRDPIDVQDGAEFALGCLLPILYGREVSEEELVWIKSLSDDELLAMEERLCRDHPDFWWPYHANGTEKSDPPAAIPRPFLRYARERPEGFTAKEAMNDLSLKPQSVYNYLSVGKKSGLLVRERRLWKPR